MELSLASAFSAQGALGHLAYIVLVASMLMRTLTWLRLLVIVSAGFAIAYGVFVIHDPVTVIWESALVAVNIVQLLLLHWRNLRARFSDEERRLGQLHLPGLTRGQLRRVLDMGTWQTLPDGAVLTQQAVPVTALSYIASGQVGVSIDTLRVAQCGAGDFVGEMTGLTGAPATATVRAEGPLLVWQIDAARLRDLVQRRNPVERELDAAFARNYRQKIMQMNAQVAAFQTPS